jgi:hypothetical protein
VSNFWREQHSLQKSDLIILIKVVGSSHYRYGSCMRTMNTYVDKSHESFAFVFVENSCEKWINMMVFPNMRQSKRSLSIYTQD